MEKKEDKVLLFLHIAKTAGTSLRKYVEKQFNKGELKELYDSNVILRFSLLNDKSNVKAVFGHFSFKHRLDTYFLPRKCAYITFMRDPVERTISQFYHFKNSTIPGHIEMMKQHPTIDKFLDSQRGKNWQLQCISGANPLLIKAHPNLCLKLAKYHIKHYFDFVGVTEKYNESLEILSKKYNWDLPVFEKKNIGKRPKLGEFSKNEIEKIKKVNNLDIKLYEYANELLTLENWRHLK